MLRVDRPPVSASVPVSVAVSRHSTNSQPAERNVPTANSATVAAAQPKPSGPDRATGRTTSGCGASGTGASGKNRGTTTAAVPASAATSQPAPGRSSGIASAPTMPATSTAMTADRVGGRPVVGQCDPHGSAARQGPCTGGVGGAGDLGAGGAVVGINPPISGRGVRPGDPKRARAGRRAGSGGPERQGHLDVAAAHLPIGIDHGDGSFVQLDDPAGDRETEPGPAALGSFAAGEALEDTGALGLRDARPLVRDGE